MSPQLTAAGGVRLREAALTHTDHVSSMFTALFSQEELANLAELLTGITRPPAGVDAKGSAGSSGEPGDA